jgi:hypothetical protein
MNLSIFKNCKDLCELKSVLKSVRGDEKYSLEIPILVLMKKIFHIKMLSFQTQYKLKKELELGYRFPSLFAGVTFLKNFHPRIPKPLF